MKVERRGTLNSKLGDLPAINAGQAHDWLPDVSKGYKMPVQVRISTLPAVSGNVYTRVKTGINVEKLPGLR